VAGEAALDIVRTPLDHSHRRVRSGCSSARGGWHEHRELAENRSGAERREDPAVLEDLDTSFENGCDAVCWVAFFKERRGDVVLTPAEQGMDGAVAALLHDSGTEADLYAARQFENPRNVFAHQHSTGPELIQQVGVRLDGFVAGVGTGGTLMGVAHALRDHGYDTIIARAMPTATFTAEGDPEVVGGIPGIVEGMSRLIDPDAVGLEDPVLVPESEAMATAREFGRRGLGIGPSSGLNIAAARRLAARLGPGHHVGTILPDRMERYFSTALFDDVTAEL
jgi:cysteine synthase A